MDHNLIIYGFAEGDFLVISNLLIHFLMKTDENGGRFIFLSPLFRNSKPLRVEVAIFSDAIL